MILERFKNSVEVEEQYFNLNTLAEAYEKNGQYELAVQTQERLIKRWRSEHAGAEQRIGEIRDCAERPEVAGGRREPHQRARRQGQGRFA